MRIDKISLVNFRQYKNVEIKFSNDPNKNITVILGENGYGKTTLIRSFIWCLYPSVNLGFQNKELLNSEVADSMAIGQEKEVKVTIELVHSGCSYVIVTKETYKKGNNNIIAISKRASTVMYKNYANYGDYSLKSVPNSRIKTEIENILGSELKDYFFYDGETNKIESAAKQTNVKNAISKLMGIKRIEVLKEYFDPTRSQSVVSNLDNSLEGDDLDTTLLKGDLEELKKELESKKITIENHKEEIFRIENELNTKEAYLDTHQEILSLQKEKRSLDTSILQNKDVINESFTNICKSMFGDKLPFLSKLQSYIYIKYNLNELPNQTRFNAKESLSCISEEAVDQLIERGYCLCGAKITNENDAYKHLIKAKDYMEPHDYSRYLNAFCSDEEACIGLSKSIENTINKQVNNYIEDIEKTENDQERLEDIIKKIKGIPDVGVVQKDIVNLQVKKAEHATEIKYLEQDIKNIKIKIDNKSKDLERVISKTEENNLIKECTKYAKYIYCLARNKVNKRQKEVRKELQNEVNIAFSNMYHGDRTIEITEDFKAKTLTYNHKLDNSTGIETVKNFAYVSGVLKMMRKSLKKVDDAFDEKIDETYPLVMDAPFSNTDEEHIEKICATLPDYCNQLIIVMIRKDYKIAQKSIENKIGKIYEINKHSETYDTIKLLKDNVDNGEEY